VSEAESKRAIEQALREDWLESELVFQLAAVDNPHIAEVALIDTPGAV
jgi:hypothetical protein